MSAQKPAEHEEPVTGDAGESAGQGGGQPAKASASKPVRKPRKRWYHRFWFRSLIVLIVLALVLVALGPMIASTGPARSAILAQVNKRIMGTVEIDDWSLNWLSGQSVTGLTVRDPDGAEVLTIDRITVPLKLIDAAGGGRDLGDILIGHLQTQIAVLPDGSTNLQRAIASRPEYKEEEEGEEVAEKETKQPQTPPFRGTVRIEKISGNVTAEQLAQTISWDGKLTVNFARGLEQEVTSELAMTLRAGEQTGTLSANGKVTPYHGGQVDMEKLTAEQKVEFNLPAALANIVLARLEEPMQVTHGNATGSLTATVNGIKDVNVKGDLNGKDIALWKPKTNETLRVRELATVLSIHPRERADTEKSNLPPIGGNLTLKRVDGEIVSVRLPDGLAWIGDGKIEFENGLEQAITDDFSFTLTSGPHSGKLSTSGRVRLAFDDKGQVRVPGITVDQTLALDAVPPALLAAFGKGKLPAEISDGRIDGTLNINASQGLDGQMKLTADLRLATAAGVSTIVTEDPTRADARVIPTTIDLPWKDGQPVPQDVVVKSLLNIRNLPVTLANAFMEAGGGEPLQLVGGTVNASLDADVQTLSKPKVIVRLDVADAAARKETIEQPADGSAPIRHVHVIRVERLVALADLMPIVPVDVEMKADHPIPVVGPVTVSIFRGSFSSDKLDSPVKWENRGEMTIRLRDGNRIEQENVVLAISDAHRSGKLSAEAWAELFKTDGKLDVQRTRLHQKVSLSDLPAGVMTAIFPGAQLPAWLTGGNIQGGLDVIADQGLDRKITYTSSLQIGDGSLKADGDSTVAWKIDGTPDPQNTAVNATLVLQNFPAALANLAGTPETPAAVNFDRGVLNGKVTVAMANLKKIHANGLVIASDVSGKVTATGDPLNISNARIELANAVRDGDVLDLGKLDISATFAGSRNPFATIVAGGRLPVPGDGEESDQGGEFNFSAKGNIDLAAILNEMPGLAAKVKLKEGTRLTSANLTLTTARITGTPRQTTAMAGMSLKDVVGVADGQPVTLKPINATLFARKTDKVWELTQGGAQLTADWGRVAAEGHVGNLTIHTPQGQEIDLGQLYAQVAQFIDMGELAFSGRATLDAVVKGLDEDRSPIELDAKLSGRDVRVTGLGDQPLVEPSPHATVKVVARRDDQGGIDTVEVSEATLQTRLAELAARTKLVRVAAKDDAARSSMAPASVHVDGKVYLDRVSAAFGKVMKLPPGGRLGGVAEVLINGTQVGDVLNMTTPGRLDPAVGGWKIELVDFVVDLPATPAKEGEQPGEPYHYKADRLTAMGDLKLNSVEKWMTVSKAFATIPDFRKAELTNLQVKGWGDDDRKPIIELEEAIVAGDLAKLPLPPGATGGWNLAGLLDVKVNATSGANANGETEIRLESRIDQLAARKPAEGEEPAKSFSFDRVTVTTGDKPAVLAAEMALFHLPSLQVRAFGPGGAQVASLDVTNLKLNNLKEQLDEWQRADEAEAAAKAPVADQATVMGAPAPTPAYEARYVLEVLLESFSFAADADGLCRHCGEMFLKPGTQMGGQIAAVGFIRPNGVGSQNAEATFSWANMRIIRPPDKPGDPQRVLREPRFQGIAKLAIDPQSRVMTISQAKVDTQTRFLAMDASGSVTGYDRESTRRLLLGGTWQFNGEGMKTFLGENWPEDLTVASAAQGEQFTLDTPLNDTWRTRAEFHTQATWQQVAFKGFTIGQPAEPMKIDMASGKLNISRTQMPANDGTMRVEANVDMNRQMQPAWMTWRHKPEDIHSYVPWLTIKPAEGLSALEVVNINEQMNEHIVEAFKRATPLGLGAREFSGRINVTLYDVDMPLDPEVLKKTGTARGLLTVKNFRVRGGLIESLSKAFGWTLAADEGIIIEQPLDLRDGRFWLHNSTANLGGTSLTFNGWVALVDEEDIKVMKLRPEQTMQMSVTFRVTKEILEKYAGAESKIIGKDFIKYVGDAPITIPLKGTPGNPQFDAAAVPKAIAPLAAKAVTQYMLDRARKKDKTEEGAEPPAEGEAAPEGEKPPEEEKPKTPDDRLREIGRDLLGDLFGNKRKEEEKKEETP